MMQKTITEDDITACQEMNDSDREKAWKRSQLPKFSVESHSMAYHGQYRVRTRG